MAVLTESKIRKLIKTPEVQASKRLVLEPGTIITPSAKSYLTNIKVEYRERETVFEEDTREDVPVKVAVSVRNNRATQQWHHVLDKLTSKLLFDQKYAASLKENDVLARLGFLIETLQDYKKMDFLGNHYFEEDSLSLEVQNWSETYSQESFIPTYLDEELVLRLHARYLDARELEIQGINSLRDYLLVEEFHALSRSCRAMANDIWLMMIRKIETNNKER